MATDLQIPPREVQRRLALDNPWWRAGQGIDPEESGWPRRAYFGQFSSLARNVGVRRAVVLIGPRRVGKTVMLKHLVAQLLDDGVAGTQVLFLSLDTPLYSGRSLESLVQMFADLHRHPAKQTLWVLFDEVQYLKDWEVQLKSLVDTYPRIRFVASGSAAAALRMKSRESGAGRFTEFILPPLTFAEYLNFAGQEDALIRDAAPPEERPRDRAPGYLTTDIHALNVEFINYLNLVLVMPECLLRSSRPSSLPVLNASTLKNRFSSCVSPMPYRLGRSLSSTLSMMSWRRKREGFARTSGFITASGKPPELR